MGFGVVELITKKQIITINLIAVLFLFPFLPGCIKHKSDAPMAVSVVDNSSWFDDVQDDDTWVYYKAHVCLKNDSAEQKHLLLIADFEDEYNYGIVTQKKAVGTYIGHYDLEIMPDCQLSLLIQFKLPKNPFYTGQALKMDRLLPEMEIIFLN